MYKIILINTYTQAPGGCPLRCSWRAVMWYRYSFQAFSHIGDNSSSSTDTDQYNSTHIPALWFLLLENNWMNATQEQIRRWKTRHVNQIQSLHQIFYQSRLVFTRASSLAGNQFLFFKTSDRWWVVFIVYCHGRSLLHCRHIQHLQYNGNMHIILKYCPFLPLVSQFGNTFSSISLKVLDEWCVFTILSHV